MFILLLAFIFKVMVSPVLALTGSGLLEIIVTVDKVGTVLSTTKVVLGPAAAAKLSTLSEAVPAAIDIPSVPLPVIPLMLTVLVVFPVPDTPTVPLAVPVLFRVIFPVPRVTLSAPA
jgi:hypothetical protein